MRYNIDNDMKGGEFMGAKMLERVKSIYPDLLIWEFFKRERTYYLRFTSAGSVYLAVIDEDSQNVSILKEEKRIKL